MFAPLLAATLSLALAAEDDLIVHQAMPNDLDNRQIRFVIPRTEYRQDFPAERGHRGGTYLYGEALKPEKEGFNLKYRYAISEFRFRRPDGRADVVMIETSPQVSGHGMGGLFFRVPGAEFVTLDYGCDDNRACEEQYTITYHYDPEAADTFVSTPPEIERAGVEPHLRRLLQVGHRQHRRLRHLTLVQIRKMDRVYVLADELSTTLPGWYSAFPPRVVRRIARRRARIEERLTRPERERRRSARP